MKYIILDNNGKTVKQIESDRSEVEILRNYPTGYTIKESK